MTTSLAHDAGITRDIYPMPSFLTLTTRDLATSTAWYEAVGFINLFAMPGPEGSVALVHMRRWRNQDLLLVPGQPDPGTGSVLSVAADPDGHRLTFTARAPEQDRDQKFDQWMTQQG